MNWDWKKLLLAVVTAVLGWLSGSLVNPPGTVASAPAVLREVK